MEHGNIAVAVDSATVRKIRRQLNLSQKQFAQMLGVNQVTVARWESGSRFCRPDLAKRVLQLGKSAPGCRTRTIATVSQEALAQSTPSQAIECFRDLLWCEVRRVGIPLTNVQIALCEVPDGGIDARVTHLNGVQSDIFQSGVTCFQVKSGVNAKFFRAAWLRKELFGSSKESDATRENLAEGIANCLEGGGKYVLACFGVDSPPEKTRKAEQLLRESLHACGFPDALVEVWSQQQLVGLFSRFYSLCLELNGRKQFEFQSHSSWQLASEMSHPVILGKEQEQFLGRIRESLRSDQIRHIRVIGEPGLGKSRLVLEALSERDLAPAVVYVTSAEEFQRSRLFIDLLRPDGDYFVILVLDECPASQCKSIWDALRSRSDRCRIVSIDHDDFETNDELMQVMRCPRLSDTQITQLIEGYTGPRFDNHRWAEFCSGSPRVAHMVGENLKVSASDLLKEPSTVQVWERYIAGYRRLDGTESNRRRLVLRHLALFYRFGFESPVDEEARFIADLVASCDPSLTWQAFQSIVQELRANRILQGSTTLFIAPKALHIYLWQEFWKHHGRFDNLSQLIGSLPGRLGTWFLEMFRYAHDSPVASDQARRLLGPEGAMSDPKVLRSQRACNFLNYFSEGVPEATLECIERAFNASTDDELKQVRAGRQPLISALRKIAIWSHLFHRAAKVLQRLAEFDDGDNRHNAGGTFAALFSMQPGPFAPTCASPGERLPILKAILRSPSSWERRLGVEACRAALSENGGIHLFGTEYQGLRPTPPLWCPPTWGDVHDAIGSVWDLLFDDSRSWPVEERAAANQVLIESADVLLRIEHLSARILATLESLVEDGAADLKELVSTITSLRRYDPNWLSESVQNHLACLEARITGCTFHSRLRRYVLLSSWDDHHAKYADGDITFEKRLSDLADEAGGNSEILTGVLNDLVVSRNHAVYQFGYELSKRDRSRRFLSATIEAYRSVPNGEQSALLLGGFLRAICIDSRSEWERLILQLIDDPAFAKIAGALLQCSGLSDGSVLRLVAAVESGRIGSENLLALRGAPLELRSLENSTTERLIEQLLAIEEIDSALEIAHFAYCYEGSAKLLPREPTRRLLSQNEESAKKAREFDYVWSEVAMQFITSYPDEQLNLFEAMLRRVCIGRRFLDHHDHAYAVATRIIGQNPAGCWAIVTDLLNGAKEEAWLVRLWLGPPSSIGSESGSGPLALFPTECVLAWIDQDPVARAPLIAGAAPKSVCNSAGGTLTREILNRYGDSREVRDALLRNFYSTGWSGSAVGHYGRKRDSARQWLKAETSLRVRTWIEEYIQSLSESISRSEIEEERDNY
jgi:helix-turn-helix protein